MSLIEVARFYCLVIIEFVMLHCNNVSWVFLFSLKCDYWMVSDWHLIPVHDWLVSLPLVCVFHRLIFCSVPFCLCRFHFRSGFVEVRSLHALMHCFCVVYYCAFCAVSIALQKGSMFWPWSSGFTLELIYSV